MACVITSRREFIKVALGSYEEDARDVIFGAKLLSAMRDYQLLVGRYRRSPAGYAMPAKMTTGLIGWYFALGGFRILAKVDPTPLPAEIAPAIVNGNDRLVGSFVDFAATTEGQAVFAMKKADVFAPLPDARYPDPAKSI